VRRRGREPVVFFNASRVLQHPLALRARPGWPKAGPLVNEKNHSGVSTIVHNQPSTQRLDRVDPVGDGSMLLPQRVPPDSVTESEVQQKMLPRDRASAVTALFEEHYVSLVRMARLLVDDLETAEDVVMDAFTSLYRRWTAIRDPAEAHRYVRSSVLNGARSQLRRRRLRRRHESANQQEAIRDGLETNEADRSTVTQLLATLPYRQRQVLVLRYFVDLTEAQIAYELGVSPGSVKTHASRGLAALARALEGSQ
jgi:RNA polymerase sigma-70 factor (sigma-E family)